MKLDLYKEEGTVIISLEHYNELIEFKKRTEEEKLKAIDDEISKLVDNGLIKAVEVKQCNILNYIPADTVWCKWYATDKYLEDSVVQERNSLKDRIKYLEDSVVQERNSLKDRIKYLEDKLEKLETKWYNKIFK